MKIETYKTGPAKYIGQYADAVRIPAGYDTIRTSGTPGLTKDGDLPADLIAEFTQAWRNIEAVLAAAGAELKDIVNVRTWLTSANYIPDYAAVRKEFIEHEPTYMLVIVDGLIKPEFHVEIEVTAAVLRT